MNIKLMAPAIIVSVCLFMAGCGVKTRQKKGSVEPLNFQYKTSFETVKGLVLLPAKADGVQRNFLFDSGAQLSVYHRDSMVGKKGSYIGASKREVTMGQEVMASFELGDIKFSNTVFLNGSLKELTEQIDNFGGIIGQPIIRKANWLIDYPNKVLEISNAHMIDDSFRSIDIKREGGSPYTFITLNGKRYKAIIDLGSTATFNIPDDVPLAEEILKQYEFKENIRDIYSLGGTQSVKEMVGTIPLIKIGDIEFKNVYTDVRNSSQLRLGMKFFKDHIVYIDNINGQYMIK